MQYFYYFYLIYYTQPNIANITRNNHLFYFILILKLIYLTNAILVNVFYQLSTKISYPLTPKTTKN